MDLMQKFILAEQRNHLTIIVTKCNNWEEDKYNA